MAGTGPAETSGRIGIYPGSFNPPTTAHLAVAAAARTQRRLDRVVLVHGARTLGKEGVERPLFRHRHEVLRRVAEAVDWLEAATTTDQLLADIASGYDVVIMGADKWVQIQDPVWYGDDPAERDRALARLPELAVAPRPPIEVPGRFRLDLPLDVVDGVSSTGARAGRVDLMAEEARRFAEATGAWIDPDRYERHLLAEEARP